MVRNIQVYEQVKIPQVHKARHQKTHLQTAVHGALPVRQLQFTGTDVEHAAQGHRLQPGRGSFRKNSLGAVHIPGEETVCK